MRDLPLVILIFILTPPFTRIVVSTEARQCTVLGGGSIADAPRLDSDQINKALALFLVDPVLPDGCLG